MLINVTNKVKLNAQDLANYIYEKLLELFFFDY